MSISVRALFAVAAVGAACLSLTAVAAADPTADIALISMTAGTHHAKVGDSVTFSAVARNNGPDAVSLFTTFTVSSGLHAGLQTCDFGVSPDTPSCEYSLLVSGQSATSTLTVQVQPGASKHEVVTACVSDPDPFIDPDTTNDCGSAALRITGRR